MKIITYPDGRSEQIGTPLELAQFMFNLTAYQTVQKFQKLVDALPTQAEVPKSVTVTIPEFPKEKRTSKRKQGKSNAD